jgi:hypothetical protein
MGDATHLLSQSNIKNPSRCDKEVRLAFLKREPAQLTLPVLRHQPGHACEFAAVEGNENQFGRDRLAGDQDIIGTGRRALPAQMRANLACRSRIFPSSGLRKERGKNPCYGWRL